MTNVSIICVFCIISQIPTIAKNIAVQQISAFYFALFCRHFIHFCIFAPLPVFPPFVSRPLLVSIPADLRTTNHDIMVQSYKP